MYSTITAKIICYSKSAKLLSSSLVCSLAIACLSITTAYASPLETLSEADTLYRNSNFNTALKLLENAKTTQVLEPWRNLIMGKIYERQNHFKQATNFYNLVDLKSPASVEARLGLLRIHFAKGMTKHIETQLSELLPDLQLLDSKPLFDKFELLKAQAFKQSGNLVNAYALFLKIRAESADIEIATVADTAISDLEEQQPSLITNAYDKTIKKAKFYLNFHQPYRALEAVQIARNTLQLESIDNLRLLLYEARILRRLERHLEADNILTRLSKTSREPIAARALLALANYAWNKNRSNKALDALNQLINSFPSSKLFPQASYIKARIFEELKRYSESANIYSSLISDSLQLKDKLKALKRLAWIHFRTGNLILASKYFRQTALLIKEEFQTNLVPSSSTAVKYYTHALYWEAKSLEALQRKHIKGYSQKTSEINALYHQILDVAPYSYYGILASTALSAPDELSKALNSLSQENCILADTTSIKASLPKATGYKSAGILKQIIIWNFGKSRNLKDSFSLWGNSSIKLTEIVKSLDERQLKELLSMASLLNTSLNPSTGLKWSARILNLGNIFPGRNLTKGCVGSIIQNLHPTPYRDLVTLYSKTFALKPDLAYAIMRTESHFIPDALSRVGAKGLMQLMKQTAVVEGLQNSEDLFSPEVNIRLGTKHLARLLRHFDGNVYYAVAAYNAGISAVESWIKRFPSESLEVWTELIPYKETRNYLKKVLLARRSYTIILDS